MNALAANLQYILGPQNMFYHVHVKTITFVKMGIFLFCILDTLLANLRHNLRPPVMFLHDRVITFVEMSILVILCFYRPPANLRPFLEPLDMFLYACAKTITFVKMSILIILCFRRHTGQPHACFIGLTVCFCISVRKP